MKTIEVQGVWIRREFEHLGGRLSILVQTADGQYREVFAEHQPVGHISHCVHPAGIAKAPVVNIDGR